MVSLDALQEFDDMAEFQTPNEVTPPREFVKPHGQMSIDPMHFHLQ